ncbi:MAG TPA: 5-formyltetrahydrofolate cyclo-ligase [Casimicrobiaceae bacterium]|jgi:5-formyltetrahydrofolate cyclo-ligase
MPRQPAPLRAAKEALRAQIVAARLALPLREHAARSQAIAQRLAALASWQRARAVLLTLPVRGEWDASLVARAALATGRMVVLPRVDAPARMLALHRIDDLARDVAPGRHGIPEPRPECEPIAPDAIDWVLVPGVAFDTLGHRLGYGGGYYDRLLPLLAPGAARVAGAFELQIVDAVPHAAHDLPVDAIVTESRQIGVRPGKA